MRGGSRHAGSPASAHVTQSAACVLSADRRDAITLQVVVAAVERLLHTRELLEVPGNHLLHRVTSEALRTYTEGRAAFERGNELGAAAELFLQATRVDPDVALAYTWLGWCRLNSSGGRAGIQEFAKGDELAQAASPEERLWARGSHLTGLRDAQGAKAAYWGLLQLDPLHFWALNNINSARWDDLREYEWVISFWSNRPPHDQMTSGR